MSRGLRRRLVAWKGLDAAIAQPAHVDDRAQFMLPALLQAGAQRILRLTEAEEGPAGDAGGLQHQHLPRGDGLAHFHGVDGDRLGQGAIAQPDRHGGMALEQQHHGIEAGLLESRRKQERAVEAGGEPAIGDEGGAPDLLPPRLEARGRLGIMDVPVRQGDIDGGRECAHPARIVALIAIHAGRKAVLLQQLGGGAQQLFDGGIVGHHESRQKLRHVDDAAPLVAGQEADGKARLGDDTLAGAQHEGQLPPLRLV